MVQGEEDGGQKAGKGRGGAVIAGGMGGKKTAKEEQSSG